jgi:hypothetical protein
VEKKEEVEMSADPGDHLNDTDEHLQNPKHEIRNSKQYQSSNVQNLKQIVLTPWFCGFGHSHFGHLKIVSDFVLRVSDLLVAP